MQISKFADKDKLVPEGNGQGDFDGKPIRRQRGMIYWYRWGRHSFDIRVVRKVLGLPEEHAADKWFMEYSSYYNRPTAALSDILGDVRRSMGDRAFKSVIKEHDAVLRATS